MVSLFRHIKILKNFFSLTTAEVINRAAALIYLPYIARVFGPDGFGKVNFAESVAGYFMLAANFGFDVIGMREVAKFKEKKNAFAHILFIELVTSCISFLALCAFVYFIPKPLEIKMLIVLYGLTLITFAFTIDWFFIGLEWMGAVAVVSMVRQFFYIGLILLIIRAPGHLWRLPMSFIAADIVAIVIFFCLFFARVKKQDFKIEWRSVRYFSREALPLGVSNFLNSSRDKVGPVVLGFLRSISEVGFFSVGYKLLCVANIIPLTLNRAIFPNMAHALKNKTHEEARAYIRKIFEITSIIAFPAAFLIFYNADFFVRFIFGPSFQDGIYITRIIIWSTALLMFNKLYYYYMVAIGAQKRLVACCLAGLAVNIGLCLIFVKVWGGRGAALAFLVSELVIGVVYYFASGARTAPGREFVKAFICFSPSLLFCFFADGRAHPLIITSLAAVLYAAIVFKAYDIKSLFKGEDARAGGYDVGSL